MRGKNTAFYRGNTKVFNILAHRTDYIGEFIYEQNAVGTFSELAIIHHEEGRIVPNSVTGAFEYQYHLKDHLGNTRLTFTTRPKTIDFSLNYEGDTNLPDDQGSFEKMENIIDANIHDHTDTGTTYTQSQKLTGANNSIIGSVLTIPVGKGDQISAEVYAKYLAATPTSNPVASIASALIGAITGSTGTSNYEGVINGATVNSDGSLVNALGNGVSSTEPKAFINLMFLTDDASEIGDFAYKQVTSSSSNVHAILALDQAFEAPSAGYVVVYLSNESSLLTEVYFDDLKVTVNESKIIQVDDYYPFGLAHAGGYQRSTGKENKLNTFQDQELITDLDLNWVQFKWRNHDPTIGRFFNVDPLAHKLPQWSPYVAMGDNPINNIDPDGRYFVGVNGEKVKVRRRKGQLVIKSSNASSDLEYLISEVNKTGSKRLISK